MKKWFWDIESYKNYFCVCFITEDNFLEVHYLVNSKEDEEKVIEAAKDSGYEHKLYNLVNDASRFKYHFRRQKPSDGTPTLLSSFLGVEEEVVKPRTSWYYSYNGLHYDLPMIAFVESTILGNSVQTTTESIRRQSDKIISDSARKVDTSAFELYGNQVDVPHLIDVLFDGGKLIMGLKTIVGVKGGSIIESESTKSGVAEDVYEETLYCINDCVEMRDHVYKGKLETEESTFADLLASNPHLSDYGITKNSTSAQFVEYIVSPEKPIEDYPSVSYLYPAKHIAQEKNIEQMDMLEYVKNWYIKTIYNGVAKYNLEAAQAHLVKFMNIYDFYASFRDKNWNTSARHFAEHGLQPHDKKERFVSYTKYGTYLPLIDRYGNDSGTYINFSFGGVHGAEINMQQLKQDRQTIKWLKETYGQISNIPSGLVNSQLLNLIKLQSRTSYKGYPVRFSHEIPQFFYTTEPVDDILDPEDFTPFCVQKSDTKDENGQSLYSETLLKRYTYSTKMNVVHQDFAGYYPMLMINMGVFYDGTDIDIYRSIYEKRLLIKNVEMKKVPYGSEEYKRLDLVQTGLKLILNSASGILDGNHDTNLRANNKSLSMRILGQLCTFVIAQALALEGACVPSSNTDGIYVGNIDWDLNKKILDRELTSWYVTIDPEHMEFISKDTNNRMELEDGVVKSAKGGTLAAWKGALIEKRLAHPAMIDRLLTMYLPKVDLNKPIDVDLVNQCIDQYIVETDPKELVIMSSWVMRPTSGSIFVDQNDNVYPGTIRTWLTKSGHKLSKYVVKKQKRSKSMDEMAMNRFDDELMGDPKIIMYLERIGIIDKFKHAMTVGEFLQTTETSIPHVAKVKISQLPDTAYCHIDNRSIHNMTEDELKNIINQLDKSAYAEMMIETLKSWHNTIEPSLTQKGIELMNAS